MLDYEKQERKYVLKITLPPDLGWEWISGELTIVEVLEKLKSLTPEISHKAYPPIMKYVVDLDYNPDTREPLNGD